MMFGVCAVPAAVAGASSSVGVNVFDVGNSSRSPADPVDPVATAEAGMLMLPHSPRWLAHADSTSAVDAGTGTCRFTRKIASMV